MKIPINIKSGEIKKQDKSIIVGIDLGTTNSLVAYIHEGSPKAVKDKDGIRALVPSILHFSSDGPIMVGDEAKTKLVSDPKTTIYSVKRLMGKSYKDIGEIENHLGYEVIDNDEDSLVKIKVGEKFYTPTELSSHILKALKARIEEELNQPIEKAVITVPAYFNDTQRQATRDAGKLAGLDVLRIVNEPTAASLAYGIGAGQDTSGKIAVYDLGGGTFDITILEIDDGVFDVLSTQGNTFLGGDDFDRKIVEKWIGDHHITDSQLADKSFIQSLRLKAEEAKKMLSSEEIYTTTIDKLKLSISRSEFNEIIQPLVQETLVHCKKAITDADLSIDEISEVIMVGGSTRVPLVKNQVAAFFGKEVNDHLNPDEVVALGAAIQADILAGNRKDILLLDVTPLSLGIETMGGLMDVIIPRNNKVPTRQARNYTTSVDGQSNLMVAIYQGERDLVEHNRKLGEFILKGIPPMPAGIPKIQVQFALDADGILTVKALEERSSTETQVEIRSQYGISEEEMGKMLIDSLQNAESDMKIKALIEAKTEARSIILSTEKFIHQNRSFLNKDEVIKLKDFKEKLEESINGKDKDAIQFAMEALNKFATPIAHQALDINIGKSLEGKKL